MIHPIFALETPDAIYFLSEELRKKMMEGPDPLHQWPQTVLQYATERGIEDLVDALKNESTDAYQQSARGSVVVLPQKHFNVELPRTQVEDDDDDGSGIPRHRVRII